MNCTGMFNKVNVQRTPIILFPEGHRAKNMSQQHLDPLVMLILFAHTRFPHNFGGTWSDNEKIAA
jgi:hypothetical protein